jgi:hypothetical protein
VYRHIDAMKMGGLKKMNLEDVILSGDSRSLIARGAVERPAVCLWLQRPFSA